MSPSNVPYYQFECVRVAAGVRLVSQGIAQLFRCILAIRTGEWLKPDDDVEELEAVLQKEGLSAIAHGSEAIDVVKPGEPRR